MANKNTLVKGETSQFRVKMPTTVTSAPSWSLVDGNGTEILSGFAVSAPNYEWTADVTLAPEVVLDGGEETWEIIFLAVTVAGREIEKTLVITVIDASDNWKTHGLLYRMGSPSIKDTLLYSDQPTVIGFKLVEGYDTDAAALATLTLTSPTPVSTTSRGYAYSYTLPVTGITKNSANGRYPYQLVITAEFAGKPDEVMTLPVYVLSPSIAHHVNSLMRYLDKARLTEVDPNLQWHTEELVHYLMQGAEYVNSVRDISYWTINDMPIQLHASLQMAAAWTALNARFLAEGMVGFEFQGSNTQLTTNRRDVIQTKMDELRSVLDNNLPPAKANAIKQGGPGTPPTGVPGVTRGREMGTLGIAYGPMTNRSWPTIGNNNRTSGPWRLY